MRNKLIHRESGYTMIGVLIIFTIITVLGLSIVTLSFASVKTSTNDRDFQSAYYIAEAGITQQMNKMENEIMAIYNKSHVKTETDFLEELSGIEKEDVRYDTFEEVGNHKPTAEISVSLLSETDHQFLIESIGKVGDQERTVRQTFSVEWQDKDKEKEEYKLPPFTVFTSGDIKVSSGSIIGDIGTLHTKKSGIHFSNNGGSHTGDIYVPNGEQSGIVKIENSGIKSAIKAIDTSYEIPTLPEFPEIPTDFTQLPDTKHSNAGGNTTDLIKNKELLIVNYITNNYSLQMNEDLTFKSIKVNEKNNFYINVGNTDKSIVVDHLDVINGHIKLEGTGKLTIYVKNKFTMGAGSTINSNGDINRVNIFYKGVERLNLAGDQKIYGSLYAEKASLNLSGSGGIHGNVFTGGSELKLSGGSNVEAQLILAPHAAVNMSGGGTVHGKIISKTFSNDGGAIVKFGEPFVLDGPISPDALGNGSDEGNGSGNISNELTGNSPAIHPEPIREKNNE